MIPTKVEAVAKFISDLRVHFMRPKAENEDDKAHEKIWLKSMMRGLQDYNHTVLEKAAADFLSKRTDRRFPLLAECKKICDEIARFEKLASPKLIESTKPEYSSHPDWQYKLADELINCEMGRKACKEGWQLSLHDFIRKEMRLPASGEIQGIQRASKGFDEAYETCVLGKGGVANAQLLRLGGMMLARREAIRARVLGAAR